MKYLTTFYNWIRWSSANPEKISMTLKYGVPFVVLFFSYVNVLPSFDEAVANQTIDLIVNFIVVVGSIVSGILTAYGLIRKIFKTVIPD